MVHGNTLSWEPWNSSGKIFPGFTLLGILDEIQKTMTTELKCEPEHFKGRIIFMAMYNIDWENETENCIANAHRVTEYARRFTRGHLVMCRAWVREEVGTYVSKPDGQWDKTAEDMMLNFAESGHPIFRATFRKRRIEKQRKRKEVYSFQRKRWNRSVSTEQ